MARLVHDRSLRFARRAVQWPGGDVPTEQALMAGLERFSVLLTGERAYLKTEAGQAAALMAANQLARLFLHLQVEIPSDIALRVVQPLGEAATTLEQAVMATITAVYPWGSIARFGDGPAVHAILALGGVDSDSLPEGVFVVRARGAGWMVRVGEPAEGPCFAAGQNPMGALVSVAFAALEVYKAFLRKLLPSGVEPNWDLTAAAGFTLSLLDYSRAGSGHEFDALPASIDLGDVTFVSAGAMAHCALYGLLAAGARGHGRVTEPKTLDEPDLNRYMLAGAADLDAVKPELFAARAGPALSLDWESRRYQDSTHRALLQAEERHAPLAILGVDHPPSRIDVQRDWPNVLVNGATEHSQICVSRHSATDSDLACIECVTPNEEPLGDEPIPTLGPVSAIAGLLLAAEVIKERTPGLAGWRLQGLMWVSTLRPDSMFGVRPTSPPARPDCACQERLQLTGS
ncbi:MAG TPA: hypothetical protein VFF61_07165 [Microvirga sp.]|nr:hypothetical protein [Microvirga sp.]